MATKKKLIVWGKVLDSSNKDQRYCVFSADSSDTAANCGTPMVYALHDAVANFHKGLPIGGGITVDEVEMTVHDDWAESGLMHDGEEDTIIYAPSYSIKGESELRRFLMDSDIDGFTPVRGHEYLLNVRRFYLTTNPFYCHYELISILGDTLIR
ncbi:MAG: hypothetical protein IJ222_05370 [Bacteroidales bacterium]|nr:hypothetical protein [Bacteroidales bacterium]